MSYSLRVCLVESLLLCCRLDEHISVRKYVEEDRASGANTRADQDRINTESKAGTLIDAL